MATDTSRARDALGIASNGSSKISDKDKAISLRTSQIDDGLLPQLRRAAPHGVEVDQIARDLITALRLNDDLWKCTPTSLFGGAMVAAQVGLRIGVLGHGWLLPFRNTALARQMQVAEAWEAQWVLGYQGMIELAHRTGTVLNIVGHTIYSKEQWRILYGAEERIEHQPLFEGDRGEPVVYYSQAWFTNGGYGFHPERRDDLLAFAETLRSWQNRNSPWHKYFEPMAWKTCLRRQWRFMPKTAALALALDADDAVPQLQEGQLTLQQQDRPDQPVPTDGEPEQPQREVIDVQARPASGETDTAEPAAAAPKRRRQPDSGLRKGLISALREKYTDDEITVILHRHILRGEVVEFGQVTNDELRAALAWRPTEDFQQPAEPAGPASDDQAAIDAQMDAEYAADMERRRGSPIDPEADADGAKDE